MKKGSQIVSIIFLMAFWVQGCFERPDQDAKNVYNEKKHGVSFQCPPSFLKTSGEGIWSSQVWKSSDEKVTAAFKATWNQDLKFFPLDMALDMYFTTFRSKNPTSTIYVDERMPFVLESGTKAIGFRAIDGDWVVRGIYAVGNNREYVVSVRAVSVDEKSKAFEDCWTTVKKGFNVEMLPDHKKYVRQVIAEAEHQENSKIRDILDYGQQLMSSKEAYSTNYPRAIMEFRKALSIMENLTPKPQEYIRALRLIYIAKELQRKAYNTHETLFISDARQLKWEEAVKEGRILLDLMQDDRESPMASHARDFLELSVSKFKLSKQQE